MDLPKPKILTILLLNVNFLFIILISAFLQEEGCCKMTRIKKYIISFLLLTSAIWLIYFQTLNFNLQSWDNEIYIWHNSFIKAFTWSNLQHIFTKFFVGNYAPVQMLSYMVDYAVWETNPLGFHLTNIVLHWMGSLLLYLLLWKLTQKWSVATIASLIFAVHPIQVETVAWLAQRKSLLAAVFFFLSFYVYCMSRDREGLFWTLASLGLFVLSLLSKISAITMPLLLLLYEYSYKKVRARTVYRLIPFFIVSAIFTFVAIKSQELPSGYEPWGGSLYHNILTVLVTLRIYILKFLFPFHLSAYYDFSYENISDPGVIGSIFLLLIVLLWIIRLYKKNPALGYWILWPFILLVPNLQIVPLPIVMADRYLHLPIIGLSVFIGDLLARLFEKRKEKQISILVIAVLIFSSYTATSFERAKVWKDDLSLWKDTVIKTPNYFTFYTYGTVLKLEGRFQEAEMWLRKSLVLNPSFYLTYKSLGSIYDQQKEYDRAVAFLRKSVDLLESGEGDDVWELLGNVYQKQGKLREAVGAYERSLQINAYSESVQSKLVNLYVQMGELPKAGRLCEALIRVNPNIYQAHYNLGMYYHQIVKDDDLSLKHFDRAIQINPKLLNAYFQEAVIYESRKNIDKAVENYENFLTLNKIQDADGVRAANNLAFLYAEHKPARLDEALQLAEKINILVPHNGSLLDTLGWVHYRRGNYRMANEMLEKGLSCSPNNLDILLHLSKTLIKLGQMDAAKKTLKETWSRPEATVEQRMEAEILLKKLD
ncbi:hypothetical protein CO110_03665 [Candidatus Desantisbacteria bacterium CG_4_9_14_3_um_filter_40_11]|uniref:Uncharacterized protein n=1 Tax=Candidatus Desantisbacteria bacterium CG_4_9_14_3_um_filter_40_11 TaxID=1974546 RepID=A0A2M8AV96_9BACT|nr:MAG: hypothetical protein CO110_03665 [Candidatus Desantisbacteria bacterium CG_4_9_14_3_um_filter_40_11]